MSSVRAESEATASAAADVLRIEDLHTEIRMRAGVVRAVDGLDLTVRPGEVHGLVGESGCGKTMTALSVMRLLPPGGHVTGGKILLGGRDLAEVSERRMQSVRGNDVAMIFQDPLSSLNPTVPVGNQICEAVRLHRDVSAARARARAVEVLDLVGIAQAAQRLGDYPHEFSGGMRQRVMIAMALACDPALLIADEPTTALDVTIQAQILDLIDQLRSELSMAVLLVTHDLGVVAGRADRVSVMYAGRVVETGVTEAVFARPRHRYTQALFRALPETAVDHHTRLYSIPGLPPDLSNPPEGCRFAPRCRFAQDDCRATDPPMRGGVVDDRPGTTYACLHPVGEGELWEVATGEGATGAKSDDVLLSAVDLVKDFPLRRTMLGRSRGAVSAVAGVSFDVRRGHTLGLVGESGCGKTTTGRLLVGLDRPTSGTVIFDGHDVHAVRGQERRQVRRSVQFMFQDSYASLDPRMRVGAILAEPMQIQRIGDRRSRRARVRELLDAVGLPATSVGRYPHEFSGGQRQRLGLARALSLEPRLIVADEPVSALDVSIQAQVLNTLRELQRDRDLTFVVISHDLSVVRYLSDRIGVMYLGKLVEEGPAEDVHGHPLHPYTHGLIATVPVADPSRERLKARARLGGELPSAIDPPSGCRFRTRCPLATEVCATVEPPLRELRPGHRAACHHPLETPPVRLV